jgi:hypothetical protein
MWIRRILVLGCVSIGVFFLIRWIAPSGWSRAAGILELVVVVDNSGSYEQALPIAQAAAPELLRAVLPGDRLAVFAVGPKVLRFFSGVVDSPARLTALDRELQSLSVNTNGGTAMAAVFAEVRQAFDDFAVTPSPHRKRLRMLVLFSDCLEESGSQQTFQGTATVLPAGTSVLVVGWKGSDRDPVARAMLGTDGRNVLQAIPTEGAPEAVRVALQGIANAHPVALMPLAGALLGCAALGMIAAMLSDKIAGRRGRPRVVVLRSPGRSDTEQTFTLAPGSAITIGGGAGLHDFTVDSAAHCSLALENGRLCVAPGGGQVQLRRGGRQHAVREHTPLQNNDLLVLERDEVEVDFNA